MWCVLPNSWAWVRIGVVAVLVSPASLAWPFAMASSATREAPNMSAVPVNQLVVAGNACGPAALLNALRFGDAPWQRAAESLAGSNDKESLLRIIREIGMRPSKHVPGHPRWSRRGVSVVDLQDMANEMTMAQYLPAVRSEVMFCEPGESPEQLVRRAYQRLDRSLAKGFPPILSVRRYARRRLPATAAPQWVVIDAHFVTLTVVPRQLDRSARAFSVSYLDPWGGKRCHGVIGIPEHSGFAESAGQASCLEAVFPQSPVGRNLVTHDEPTILVLAAVLGRW